ncbi:DUF4430 domain-containing protein [Clostridium cochlearium]|uniref:DUF4430 domain-containing protein n=1 Tax=Clostridium cochlearium TaxID=1494 RepID=UPI0022E3760A|nr:DUF4430 domain-containing protein [Clostridium cochlearium]
MNIKINTRRKRILSFIIALSMILSSFNFNLFNSKAVHAEEMTSINESTAQKDGSTINTIIDGVIDYYNNEHFVTNQSQLIGYEYSAMYRAGADLSKKQWHLNEKFEPSFDKELKYIGNMADQSLILIDLGKDANNYDGRHFINEIVEKIDRSNNYFGQREIRGVIALDKYNEKFSDKKVNYNEKHAIEKILDAQCEDGGFKERKTSTIINTAYALMALSKHKDIEGVNGAISKALTYLHDVQKDDGGFYDKSFITGNHVEALRGLIAVGENPTSKQWTKSSDKNPVYALFTLWKDNNSFDAQKGESINNRGWVEATWKALYALVDLKEAGYGEYLVNGVKVKGLNDGEDDKEEKICKVNVAIVLPENGKYVSYFKPQEVTISDKKHDKGFTALGALQASTTLYKILGKMVTSIYGYENKGLNGWMYSVNGVIPNIMAEDYKVKDGDKIIWYYSIGGMDGKKPTWEELTGGKPEEKPDENPTEDNSIEPKLVEVFAGESFTLNIKMDKGNYFVYESEIPGVNNGNIKIENGIKFNIPKDAKAGEYKLKNIVIYNIDESSLEKFPDEIKQGLLEKMLGDEENKVTNLPDITVVIKDESIEPKQKEYEKEVEKAINDVKEYYKEFNGSFGKTYNYITSMALRHLGVDTSEIASKANIYGMDNIHNTARNIMNIIAMGENPENYNGKNYIKLLLDDNKKFYDDDSGYVAKAIIALDMAETNYDSEEAIKALISKAHDEGDGKYSFGSEEDDEWSFDSEYVVNIDDTIVVLIALANHKDVEGVTEKINGIKKYLKTLQTNNGFIKQKTSWSEEESCHITANMIQALIALGEDPLSNEWTKEDEKGNKVNMLDAILSCKEGKEFKGNRNAALTSDIDTSAAFAALVDLSKNKSMYNELRYKKIGEPSVIKIKGESEISLIKGEERLLIAETFDSNGIKVENTKFVWESSNKDICSVEDGKLKGIKKGNTDITVKLLNNEKISKTINITVTEDKDYREKIKKSLDKLKIYYDKHNSYDYMSALALHHISDDLNSDLKKIGSSLRLYRKDYAIHYAKNIMEIIAAGKNVKDYNNKNYIKLLTDSQSTNGEFIVNNSGDADKIVTLSLSIIALDMAEADYNVEKAINRLVSMVKDGKHEIDGLYTEVETKALAITALSKHKDIDEVNEAIKSSLEYIKNNQNEDAGFDHAGYKNNPFAIGTVIQALIANNIDPLSWSKNGKTMLDVLIERQMENGGFEYNESLPNTPKNEIFDDFKCTETAFAALADMYNMKSMYHEIRFNREQPKEEEPKPEKKSIEIENLTTDKEFKLGCDAEVTIKATNKTEENKDAALIVGLFNKDGQFVNYGAAEQNIKVNENVNLTVGLQLPKEGEYTVKAFVWNSLNEMEPLSKVIEIPVK